MSYPFYLLWSLLPLGILGTSIPFISNVILRPRYLSNFTIVANQSVDQCLCLSLPSFVAFNWFPNHTCQLFRAFPITYKIQSMAEARLYFPQRVFPNASQCCMPDLGYLLDRLRNGLWTSVNVNPPRNLILDNNGYLVTVEQNPPVLLRLDAQNLSLISRTNMSGSYAMDIGFINNAYFIGLNYGPIFVINSRNLALLNTINSAVLQKVRGIIFLNQGGTMVVASTAPPILLFFSQNSLSFTNYSYANQQALSCPTIHGLLRQSDTLFYGTSWANNSVYTYSAIPNSGLWSEKLLFDATPLNNVSGGTYVTTDECGRFWFSMETFEINVFDSHGGLLGKLSFSTGLIVDTLISDNYVMYFSDRNTPGSRIIRIDPGIQC